MRVMAIDPGKMTGIAWWRDGAFEAWALPYDEALDYVMEEVELPYAVDVVTMEDFVISERTAKTSSAGWKRGKELEFIGAVRWGCGRCRVEFNTYTPAEAKGFSTDAKLKRLGMWTKGLDHPRDATRHLVLWLASHSLLDPTTLVGDA